MLLSSRNSDRNYPESVLILHKNMVYCYMYKLIFVYAHENTKK